MGAKFSESHDEVCDGESLEDSRDAQVGERGVCDDGEKDLLTYMQKYMADLEQCIGHCQGFLEMASGPHYMY